MNDNESPFVDDWADEAMRERYKAHAKENYETFKSFRDTSFKASLDWGRWLVASLLAIHGGAIYILSGIYKEFENDKSILVEVLSMNVFGVCFAIICGFFTWLNYQALSYLYARHANPAIMYRNDADYHHNTHKTDPIMATYFLSIASGLISLGFFIVSSNVIFHAIK